MDSKPLGFKGFNCYLGVGLAAFADFGIAWDASDQFSGENFINGYGVGFRFLVPFIDVIRFDFALGEPGEGLLRHFGVPWKAVKQRQRVL